MKPHRLQRRPTGQLNVDQIRDGAITYFCVGDVIVSRACRAMPAGTEFDWSTSNFRTVQELYVARGHAP